MCMITNQDDTKQRVSGRKEVYQKQHGQYGDASPSMQLKKIEEFYKSGESEFNY